MNLSFINIQCTYNVSLIALDVSNNMKIHLYHSLQKRLLSREKPGVQTKIHKITAYNESNGIVKRISYRTKLPESKTLKPSFISCIIWGK